MKIDWTKFEVIHRDGIELNCRRSNLQVVPREPWMKDDREMRVCTEDKGQIIHMDRMIVEAILERGDKEEIRQLFEADSLQVIRG